MISLFPAERIGDVEENSTHSISQNQMNVSDGLHAPVALLPSQELSVSIECYDG
jgi:hypothetical protein